MSIHAENLLDSGKDDVACRQEEPLLAETTKTTQKSFIKKMMSLAYPYQKMLIGTVLFICLSVLVGMSLSLLTPLRVVTYDPTHTIHAFSKNAALHHLPPEKLKALSQRFSHVLEETLKTYAKVHHVVILKPQEVIVAEGDITPEIEQLVSQHMKEENK